MTVKVDGQKSLFESTVKLLIKKHEITVMF